MDHEGFLLVRRTCELLGLQLNEAQTGVFLEKRIDDVNYTMLTPSFRTAIELERWLDQLRMLGLKIGPPGKYRHGGWNA